MKDEYLGRLPHMVLHRPVTDLLSEIKPELGPLYDEVCPLRRVPPVPPPPSCFGSAAAVSCAGRATDSVVRWIVPSCFGSADAAAAVAPAVRPPPSCAGSCRRLRSCAGSCRRLRHALDRAAAAVVRWIGPPPRSCEGGATGPCAAE